MNLLVDQNGLIIHVTEFPITFGTFEEEEKWQLEENLFAIDDNFETVTIEEVPSDIAPFKHQYVDGVFSISPNYQEPPKTIGQLEVDVDTLNRQINVVPPTQDCTLDDYKKYKIALSQKLLSDYFSTTTATYERNGVIGTYSITKDKQDLLKGEIMMASGSSEYTPSWNETGKPCTYDWTLEQLMGLAYAIAAIVKPKVSQQQTIETHINEATTKEEVDAIEIVY